MRKKPEDVNSREQDRDRDDKPTLGNTPQRKASLRTVRTTVRDSPAQT